MLGRNQLQDFSLAQPSQVYMFQEFASVSDKQKQIVKRLALKHYIEHFREIDFADPQNSAYLDEFNVWLYKLSIIGVAEATSTGYKLEMQDTLRRFLLVTSGKKVDLKMIPISSTGNASRPKSIAMNDLEWNSGEDELLRKDLMKFFA